VQVTVPEVGIAFLPRTVKGAAVPRFGATWAHAEIEARANPANPRMARTTR